MSYSELFCHSLRSSNMINCGNTAISNSVIKISKFKMYEYNREYSTGVIFPFDIFPFDSCDINDALFGYKKEHQCNFCRGTEVVIETEPKR